ncbi:hypothetical protein QN362_12465 [Actimicrobium sp. CCC2.4]|uniref:hypothetical protein n=1 Tax=Actimicrobium sp. CCC2.4 TaxID=3048606 RepID=UPI002AC936F1|nr:hypothetical protein [Actimicrobium sp. CCC2.4]MEB0136147.1 hypothetical protein [Actimicrobium sp. CCC2.4]WPX32098.1 hypothetical protein RHM62_18030 [Actimicrobium sp. CCC2.4]
MSIKVGEEMDSSTSKARVVVSAREGIIEIEGSESFVADQLNRLKTVICQVVATGAKWRNGIDTIGTTSPASATLAPQALEKFANLYTQADGKLQLLKNLPGNNMANKTVNAALLVAHAHALMGADHTTLDTIRAVCKEQACHDSNNFSATLKREKTLFVHSGSLHITLSPAGRERAASLANQLNGGN